MPLEPVAVALVALLVTALAAALVRRGAVRLGFLDQPGTEAHKQQARAVPYGGGLAVGIGLLIALAGVWLLAPPGPSADPDPVHLAPLLLGATALFLVGLVDDRRRLGARTKLACQALVAAAVVPTAHLGIDSLQHQPVLYYGLSWAWLVLISNAYNLIDHADGLCGTIAGIGAVVLAVGACLSHDPAQTLLFAALAGSLAGFLAWNLPPARLYLGDAGSLPVGFLIGAGTLGVTFWPSGEGGTPLAILSPFLITALPLFDTAAVTLKRLRLGTAILRGDRNHVGHRLGRLGLSPRRSLLTVAALQAALAAGTIHLRHADAATALIVLGQSAAILVAVVFLETMRDTARS